jgi:hypothetical protein
VGDVPFSGATPSNCAGVVFTHITWFALIEPTDNNGPTLMVTIFEVAGLPVIQFALEVSTQVTASLFTGV